METLANNQPDHRAASSVPTNPHWLWWLFLLGVLASAGVGPACALH